MGEPTQDEGLTPDIPDAAPPPVVEPPADVQPAMDPWAAFDRWAGNLFLLLALLAGLSFLLLAGAIGGSPGAFVALAFGSIAVVIALLGVTMLGLRDHASWARPAAEALLWVIVAMGVLQVVADLSVQKITIPIGTILALAVLWRRPSMRPRPAARDRRIAWLIGATYVLTTVPGLLSPFLANPPAILLPQHGDLALAATADCGDPVLITPGAGWTPRLGIEGDTPLAREGELVLPCMWRQGHAAESFGLSVFWAHDDHREVRVPAEGEPPADGVGAV